MAIKTINLMLDPEEFAFAISKKGSRTWKEVLFDGLEYKVYTPPKTHLEGYQPIQRHAKRTK